jgi:hypothetical protein
MDALKSWQPDEPSPIVQIMAPRFLEMMRQQRRRKA